MFLRSGAACRPAPLPRPNPSLAALQWSGRGTVAAGKAGVLPFPPAAAGSSEDTDDERFPGVAPHPEGATGKGLCCLDHACAHGALVHAETACPVRYRGRAQAGRAVRERDACGRAGDAEPGLRAGRRAGRAVCLDQPDDGGFPAGGRAGAGLYRDDRAGRSSGGDGVSCDAAPPDGRGGGAPRGDGLQHGLGDRGGAARGLCGGDAGLTRSGGEGPRAGFAPEPTRRPGGAGGFHRPWGIGTAGGRIGRGAAGRGADSGVNALIRGGNGVSVSRRYHVGIASVRKRQTGGLRPRALRRGRGPGRCVSPILRVGVQVRQGVPASGWRRALSPAACASSERPARGATGTSLGAGRGVGWRGCASGVRARGFFPPERWVSPTLQAGGQVPQDLRPSGRRRALSPALALRGSARAGCHRHVARCGPGCGGRWRVRERVRGFHGARGGEVKSRRISAV